MVNDICVHKDRNEVRKRATGKVKKTAATAVAKKTQQHTYIHPTFICVFDVGFYNDKLSHSSRCVHSHGHLARHIDTKQQTRKNVNHRHKNQWHFYFKIRSNNKRFCVHFTSLLRNVI